MRGPGRGLLPEIVFPSTTACSFQPTPLCNSGGPGLFSRSGSHPFLTIERYESWPPKGGRFPETAPPWSHYPAIVVGAGSASAVVANRLSADPGNRVLLLEADRSTHSWSRIPIGFARLITNPAANWLYSSEPDESTNGPKIPVPGGTLLGGSSSIYGARCRPDIAESE